MGRTTGRQPQILSSATANFTSADVGKGIYIAGAGASGAGLVSIVQTVTNATTVQIYDGASTSVTGAVVKMGSGTKDDTHPTPYGHTLIAAPISGALTSGLIN